MLALKIIEKEKELQRPLTSEEINDLAINYVNSKIPSKDKLYKFEDVVIVEENMSYLGNIFKEIRANNEQVYTNNYKLYLTPCGNVETKINTYHGEALVQIKSTHISGDNVVLGITNEKEADIFLEMLKRSFANAFSINNKIKENTKW